MQKKTNKSVAFIKNKPKQNLKPESPMVLCLLNFTASCQIFWVNLKNQSLEFLIVVVNLMRQVFIPTAA